ncbi:protein DpdJ [Krasilnikoviella flava]|uniref:DEAD/DEAH box helicase n=1 Tax=Krasilnikoviella flava TaxID=526729 RepID=A0A1T5KRM8_9MICO|nr:protein DpdJ [Krasilnikoviella flava]SKC66406.1 DEAD/DEAH box helicase [Krasilnikoviella flava]
MSTELVLRILDRLEALEDPLLCWGVVDGGFSTDELRHEVADELVRSQVWDLEADDLIEEMSSRGLIVHDSSASPARWRTRNGETVRLLARLKQTFPGQNWRSGTNLVSDFRYARRPRFYPKRNHHWDSPLEGLEGPSASAYRGVLEVMTLRGTNHDLLSGFQVRATRQILTALEARTTTATVVGAGTGSGKTNAFYLPAFAYLASIRDPSAWTRALAVYPRTELLKDQLGTAFAHARRLDGMWTTQVGRPLTIGALYGSTPTTARDVRKPYRGWSKRPNGLASPQMWCPGDGHAECGGELVWENADIDKGVERLTCSSCKRVFGPEQIVLTRQSMQKTPPDVLFVTTEMLNRGLSDLNLSRPLGVGAAEHQKPRMMLLDEIHTYDGTTGAQAAMVLRRWHHSLQAPVTFVGLSATLSNPVRHVADLTGVPDDQVTSITPEPAELEYEGAEYLLAVRSDPTSGASVLSTTIQASMLLPRTQDVADSRISSGVYGTKAFVFTDDLDVTNRLFSYLLDAEGQRYAKGRTNSVKPPLAALRSAPTGGDTTLQRRAGQLWDLPIAIGHRFTARGEGLRVSRTTSQDSGVSADSQLIVATASLEVGFDDPDVGVVIQHKAPRGVAAFLQRKGRAGRKRTMRPYTAVILSDYGRDRATYEAWDALFDPVLPELVLPIRNRAVLRMQATIAMVDWLTDQLRRQGVPKTTAAWSALAKQPTGDFAKAGRETQVKAAEILEEVLRRPERQRSLHTWVQGALGLTAAETNEVLWHPPRPLLLAAIPTLRRRLLYDWAVAGTTAVRRFADRMGGNPLPDFFPMNLFSELALPETQVSLPPQLDWEKDRELQPMALGQMLREYAPGRVSRRFATRNLEHRHWIPIPLEDSEPTLELTTFLPVFGVEESCTVEVDGQPIVTTVVRPDEVLVTLPPDDIKDSSNATMQWRSQFAETGSGMAIRMPMADAVGRHIKDARFFLHAQNAHVNVHRAALSADATLTMSDGSERRALSSFTLNGERAALGSAFDVDGLRLQLSLPSEIAIPDHLMPGLRSAWFRHVLTTDGQLLRHLNRFRLDWLYQCLEAMLLTTAVRDQVSLADAYGSVHKSLDRNLDETLDAMFRSSDVAESDTGTMTKLGARLKAALREPEIVTRLDALAPQYWEPDQEPFLRWVRQRALSTIGHAVLAAARQICPEHDPESVIVDVEPGFDPAGNSRRDEVWLSESSVGGGGFIEALAARVRPDPRRFLRLVVRAVQPSTDELVDVHLQRVIGLINTDAAWTTLVNDFRSASTQTDRVAALAQLRGALRQSGIYGAEQSVVTSLASRVMRPGSTAATDKTLFAVTNGWKAEEQRLGVEIPARTWAYLMRGRSDLDSGLVLAGGATERQRMDAIQSLLWPRGWQVAADRLYAWNPFAENPAATPGVLRALATDGESPRAVRDASRVRDELARRGSVQVLATPDEAPHLATLLVDLSTEPVVTEFLKVYPRVAEIDHRPNGDVIVAIELAEVSE